MMRKVTVRVDIAVVGLFALALLPVGAQGEDGGNRPPIVVSKAWADANPVTLPAGTSVHVVASDPDGDALTYSWIKQSGAGSATFAMPTTADSGVNFSAAGTYVLRVTVTDGHGGSIASDLSIAVKPGTGDPRSDLNQDSVSARGSSPLDGYWVWEQRVLNGVVQPPRTVDGGYMRVAFGTGNTGTNKGHYLWNETTGSDFHTDFTYVLNGNSFTLTAPADPDGTAHGYSWAHPTWFNWNDRPAVQYSAYKFVGDRLWLKLNIYWGGVNGDNSSCKRFPFWESKTQSDTVDGWIVFRPVTRDFWYTGSGRFGAKSADGYVDGGAGPGDLNNDKVVNITELQLIIQNFGKSWDKFPWTPMADADGNGVVNIDDLFRVTSNFGKSY